MITIICGLTGKGKTTLATEVDVEKMLDYQKIIEMRIWK